MEKGEDFLRGSQWSGADNIHKGGLLVPAPSSFLLVLKAWNEAEPQPGNPKGLSQFAV